MTGYQCEHCACRFEDGMQLRLHYRKYHGMTLESVLAWPELSPLELTRLRFWRVMRHDGWAFAMDEVTA